MGGRVGFDSVDEEGCVGVGGGGCGGGSGRIGVGLRGFQAAKDSGADDSSEMAERGRVVPLWLGSRSRR